MKKTDDLMDKIEKSMEKFEDGIKKNFVPHIKGYEMPLLLTVLILFLFTLSIKVLIIGVVLFAVLASPKLVPLVKSKLENKTDEINTKDSSSDDKNENEEDSNK